MANRGVGATGRSRVGSVVLVLLLVAGAVAGGWWAARATLTPQVQTVGVPAQEPVWAQATQGSVGRSLALSTTVRQSAKVVAVNQVAGVVTQVSPGAVDVGDVAYVVGDTSVRVVEGDRPFFQDLTRGVTGWDVEQLQTALAEMGYLESRPDGDFGERTERAVKAWQDEQGVRETGTVAFGAVVAVPELPGVVQLGELILTGGVLAGGEEAVLAPAGEQDFVLVVSAEQARLIPSEATVKVTYEDHTWTAVIAGSVQDELGSTEFKLTAADGGPVCGDDCAELPGDAEVSLRSEVTIVPTVEGVAVPAAAVRTRADGGAYVTTEQGETEVTIRGSGQGLVIVEGVEAGSRVQVLDGSDGPGVDGTTSTQAP